MKTLLSVALTALALGFTLPALADRDRGYNNYYDRSNWHVPRHNFRQNAPRYHGPWIYPGAPRYYHGYDHRRRDYRGPYYGPGYRAHDPRFMHHHYPGGIYLFNEILHHDLHQYPRR